MTLHESSQSCSTFEDYKGLLEQPAEPKFKALLPPLWTSGLGPGVLEVRARLVFAEWASMLAREPSFQGYRCCSWGTEDFEALNALMPLFVWEWSFVNSVCFLSRLVG